MTEAMDNLLLDAVLIGAMGLVTVGLGFALALVHDAVTFLMKGTKRH